SPPFPYTTLFRSQPLYEACVLCRDRAVVDVEPRPPKESLGRSLQRAPSDQWTDRHHRRIGVLERLAEAGDGEDRPDARDRVGWTYHDRLGCRDRTPDLLGD